MVPLIGFSTAGIKAIRAVHRALSEHAPDLVAHFDRVVTLVRFAPKLCTHGAAACVRADQYRQVIFAMAPEHMAMAELGRVLLHEARHWQPDGTGEWKVFPHRCSDAFCTRPGERTQDPIYAADEKLSPFVSAALEAAGWSAGAPFAPPPPPPRPAAPASSPWGEVILGGLALGVLVGGALAIGRSLGRTWDPAVDRYRRANGQFA